MNIGSPKEYRHGRLAAEVRKWSGLQRSTGLEIGPHARTVSSESLSKTAARALPAAVANGKKVQCEFVLTEY